MLCSKLHSFLKIAPPRFNLQRHINWSKSGRKAEQWKTYSYYAASMAVTMIGVGYAGVPLYRIFCQNKGLGGNSEFARAKGNRVETMKPIRERPICVDFGADTYSTMAWNFRPMQKSVTVVPGETVLAFYTACNPTDHAITGIATYSVVPEVAGKYFNKLQCFCFEEQRLNPHEQVDLPVFFYIDPEYDNDANLLHINRIRLHYIFFESKGQNFSVPKLATS